MIKSNSDKKPKIAVIANDLSEGGFLHNFGQWLDAFDTTLFMFERRVHYTNLNLSCEMRLFSEAEETPGYMRGLEDQLQNFDLVVANNAGHFSSFQAMRAAKKWNLPFVLINHDTQPFFYKPYKNIWAIRHDNFLQADKIWVSSQLAKSVALSEGAEKEKLSVLKFEANPVDFKKFTIARKRFRKYLKINDDETVLLFKSPLESAFQPEMVLKALQLASEQGLINLSHFKVIFCGCGSLSDQLKYDSYKYKIGSSSLFLHQDATPFISDLYSASDAVIYIPDETQQTLLHFPNDLLEATNYGLTSISGRGSLYEELANGLALSLAKVSIEHLALTFSQLQSERETISTAREFFIKHQRAAINQFKNQTINDLVSLVYRDGGRSKFPSLQEAFSDMLSLVNSNQDPNALVAIENLLLMDDFKGRPRSEALRIKGDILFREGDFDQASQSYIDSLRFFNSNHNSLRGLGSLSWRSHSNQEALAYYRKALAIVPDDAEAMLGLALVYRRVGLLDESAHWLEKCLGFSETVRRAIVTIVQVAGESKDEKYAIRLLESAIESVGEHQALLVALGELLIKQGETLRGSSMLKKALESPSSV